MPIPYILFHLLFSGVCLLLALRLRGRSWAGACLSLLLGALWLIGFMIERKPSWAWAVMRLPGSGWVFVTNLSLEVAVVLMAVLWRSAKDRNAQQRAAVLSPILVGAALAGYAWFFKPLPPTLTGVATKDGICFQSTEYSCSAAAAVTLLARHGIQVTEAQMAALCLTRADLGTSSLGLYRGLSLAAASAALRPRLSYIGPPANLRHATYPCIISVGLKSDCSPVIRDRMISFGWQPGVSHSVVLLSAELDGTWVLVSDPSNGRERWPVGDLDYLWDGYALVLTNR